VMSAAVREQSTRAPYEGLTADPAQNLPRSAGLAASSHASDPSPTFHAARPADVVAAFAVVAPKHTAVSGTAASHPSVARIADSLPDSLLQAIRGRYPHRPFDPPSTSGPCSSRAPGLAGESRPQTPPNNTRPAREASLKEEN
jgi:hypothetical protein